MRKVAKLFCVMAAAAALLCSLLVGCTDKEQPRVLDEVEKSITGTWTHSNKGLYLVLYSDGSGGLVYSGRNGARIPFEFKHDGEGADNHSLDKPVRYEIITYYDGRLALCDDDKEKLYELRDDNTIRADYYFKLTDRNQPKLEDVWQ